MTLRIAAVASGRGSNVQALAKAIDAGVLDAEIAVVLSNNPDAPVLDFAREHEIPYWAVSHKGYTREAFDALLSAQIHQAKADTVVLAGYMRLVSHEFVEEFAGRILNIHPAILPSFAGTRGGEEALEYGVRITGVTVHFVDAAMDNGPVIIQGAVPVSCYDSPETLIPRIHTLEHCLYTQALQWLAEGRLTIEGRTVALAPAKKSGVCTGEHPILGQVVGSSMGTCGCALPPQGAWLISPPLEVLFDLQRQ